MAPTHPDCTSVRSFSLNFKLELSWLVQECLLFIRFTGAILPVSRFDKRAYGRSAVWPIGGGGQKWIDKGVIYSELLSVYFRMPMASLKIC